MIIKYSPPPTPAKRENRIVADGFIFNRRTADVTCWPGNCSQDSNANPVLRRLPLKLNSIPDWHRPQLVRNQVRAEANRKEFPPRHRRRSGAEIQPTDEDLIGPGREIKRDD